MTVNVAPSAEIPDDGSGLTVADCTPFTSWLTAEAMSNHLLSLPKQYWNVNVRCASGLAGIVTVVFWSPGGSGGVRGAVGTTTCVEPDITRT